MKYGTIIWVILLLAAIGMAIGFTHRDKLEAVSPSVSSESGAVPVLVELFTSEWVLQLSPG
jgi:hypothetical protein